MREKKICEIKDCGRKHYAKGLCWIHWHRQYMYSHVKRKFGHRSKCMVVGCEKSTILGYCEKHLYRIRNHLSLNLSVDCRNLRKGKKNNLWKGGVAEYPNHYQMKKNRLIKLEQTRRKCEICGKVGTDIHHKDGSKNNHSLENLILLCTKCHINIHKHKEKH
jgi:hypothetical protein